ncbi:sucrose-specific PTS transporter subunit IIBC [Corynebacterium uberis]|uniref:sucrose-specific PTS transporter subunit IIBC n=1 Tax=Corynebacterium uberis TaxID=2883169 RepID=UPI001D0AC71E|nr:sucrose-specific PTS transporter subunit IIBC [Corynebacterium uberis]UDL72949.1 sucrose-specific PTS transporter subunit IIBC [Corynebacterium uberis]UDL78386.1 sucrose-specific PTS transporter subunit IIBC [Corynebacterium uberis]UDL80669.1 sucrose-specific PTS transporter subunit IIBC [Corynebacterium uberis]UDL82804.1 sucrose-specific PTS transporter subunit IIBC [Corynebacterium uberis]UDL85011.1 sucrose-specific PTS transporter subunit IIBC [Corynebacterium uberis]
MDHKDVASRVLAAVGGEDNIVAAAHCATRLRMVLKDDKAIDRAALDNDPDLKGTFESGGMFQVIVGPGDVNEVFKNLDAMTTKSIAVSTDELKNVAANSGNWFSRAVKMLADIFVPLIPILVGGGLLMALNNVLTAEGIFGDQSLIDAHPAIADISGLINLLAAAPFAFLPVLVGFTATKRFGGNEYLGAGMGMAMVMPSLVNGYEVAATTAAGEMPYWDIFGLHVAQAGYQGTVLPVLVVSWLLATTEKFLHRHLKGTVDFLVTPVLTLLVTGFITFIAVGPVMRTAGDWLGEGLAWLYNVAGPVGGLLFGLVYSPIVITGLHQSFPPIEIQLWASDNGSFIFAVASMANIAQGAVTLAVWTLAKSDKLKGLAGASGFSAIFGITEPAIFGVNLRLRWPFFIGMGAAAIGGALIALLDVKAVALGAAGFIGVVSMRAGDWGAFLGCAVAVFILAFAAAWSYGRYLIKRNGSIDPDAVEAPGASAAAGAAGAGAAGAGAAGAAAVAAADAAHVASPLTGSVTELAAVSDPMFAAGKLGAGLAITPTVGELRSPLNGTVTVAFPSGHAFAVRGTDEKGNNVDVLMHIGFDTVNLEGKHFNPRAAKGDTVRAGDVLCEFDIAGIKDAGYEVTTPVVVANSKKTGPVLPAAGLALPGEVAAGEELFTVDPKQPAQAQAPAQPQA